jgi:hypothetical protein
MTDHTSHSETRGEYTSLNISGTASTDSAREEILYESQALSGANWFFWIAALSMINTVIILFDGKWSFLAGLGVTQFIDGMGIALRESMGNTAVILSLFLDVIAASIFVVFGLLARKRQSWAFLVGMAVYGLDGLIFLMVQDWLSLAFHAFALYCIYKGLSANNRLKQPQTETPMAKGHAA